MLSGPISGSDLFCLRPSERFWINLQARYDLEVEKDWLGAALDDIQPWVPRADARTGLSCLADQQVAGQPPFVVARA